MAERYRAVRLKSIKRLIAAGEYLRAEQALLGARYSLLAALQHPDCDEAKVGLLLTLTNSLLAECYSQAGNVSEAEEWFEHSFAYCQESHDPLVKLRLHRMYAMHRSRIGDHEEAIRQLHTVIDELTSSKLILASALPLHRIELELAYTTSCLAECMLLHGVRPDLAADLAIGVMEHLRNGSKRRYELQNLMTCIRATNPLLSPLRWRRMIVRAWFVNERHVDSWRIRVELLRAEARPTTVVLQALSSGR